jgi:hypothetical protein
MIYFGMNALKQTMKTMRYFIVISVEVSWSGEQRRKYEDIRLRKRTHT